jgi:hypothetical protein
VVDVHVAFIDGWGRDLVVEALNGCFVGAVVDVAVDAEDGLHRAVAEAVGEGLGVIALGDK